MNTAVIRRTRWIVMLLAVALAATAGYALASRSHPSHTPALSARQLAAQLVQTRNAKPGDPIYMNIVGIPGESQAASHRNWIDIDSWSFGQTSGDGGPAFTSITVTMPDSRAIPPLMDALASNTSLTVTLQAANVNRIGQASNFLTITLSQATLDNLSEGSHGGRPNDQVSFKFRRIDYSYLYTPRTGAKLIYDFCWDLNLGARCPKGA
jgi:type VI protein secretion system component Hcp